MAMGICSSRTPNMDSLAREGTRFTQFYATGATCCPTRTGLMTSKFRFIRGFGGIANRSITEVRPVLHPEGMSAISRGLSARDTPGSVRTK